MVELSTYTETEIARHPYAIARRRIEALESTIAAIRKENSEIRSREFRLRSLAIHGIIFRLESLAEHAGSPARATRLRVCAYRWRIRWDNLKAEYRAFSKKDSGAL